MKNKGRHGALDFWIFIFSVLVICLHSSNLLSVGEKGIWPGGYIAVDFFFIISGIFMGQSIDKKRDATQALGSETVEYVLHKYVLILPYYTFAFFFTFIILQIINNVSFYNMLHKLLLSIYNFLLLNVSGIMISKSFLLGNSWYLSAMLLAVFILYPIARKYWNLFSRVIGPIIALSIMGWFTQTIGYFGNWATWNNFITTGLLRAIAEISLGCTCYTLAQRLMQIKFTNFAKILLTIIELSGYFFVIFITFSRGATNLDFILLAILVICILITYSEQSALSKFFNNKFSFWLGKLSLSLYLMHYVVYSVMKVLLADSDLSYWNKLPIYFLFSILLAILCTYVGDLFRFYAKRAYLKVKKLIILN